MILPIVAYGDAVLKKEAEEIEEKYPNLDDLIANMFETMYEASGVGLAAPQIGKSIRLFIVDGSPFAEPEEDGELDPKAKGLEDFKKVFINPIIEEESGEEWGFNEGCLSIPDIREEVYRKEKVTISYYNEKWELKEEEFDGYAARIIQHEYDHVDGILFTDRISTLKKRLLSKKLTNISKGITDVKYKMRFPLRKKKR
ncbi:MAG: peptide deformylase [Crocinitomicaceae bacterium]|jgi:peptide deformylase|nr:peptide deformylase [Crocinitomicaceae bacterium]MDG1657003.1 peptide deformylase [Crocinitomicaceae bacterium]|tara:strand:- start:4885 stop:5481 length:597 start_codon:yes stop_codon:yes gene_type:complete